MRGRIRANRILKLIVERTASTTGDRFFQSLVEQLARSLGPRYALVGALKPVEAERAKYREHLEEPVDQPNHHRAAEASVSDRWGIRKWPKF